MKNRTSKAKRLRTDRPRWIRQGRLLYLFLIPLFVSIVTSLTSGHYGLFVSKLIGFGIVLLSAGFTAKGVAQEDEYLNATIAKAPKIPYKTTAMVLLGIAIFYLGYIVGHKPLLSSLFVGSLGSIGYWLYYGLDPRKDKLPDMEDINPEFVLKTLNEAKAKLHAAQTDTDKIEDWKLRKKLDRSIDNARTIIETIEQDPKDLRSARKFLMVFLDGIADVAHKYNEVDKKDIDKDMSERLYSLIDDVERRFESELERLKANNLIDLDISVDALKIQINN